VTADNTEDWQGVPVNMDFIIATWVAWIASQSIPVSLRTMFVAVAIAWLVTLGRNRRSPTRG
jgi:hypothetical protein